jgi:hypothetical protein
VGTHQMPVVGVLGMANGQAFVDGDAKPVVVPFDQLDSHEPAV